MMTVSARCWEETKFTYQKSVADYPTRVAVTATGIGSQVEDKNGSNALSVRAG